MERDRIQSFVTPREGDVGLSRITSGSGLVIAAVPNGCLSAIEHRHELNNVLLHRECMNGRHDGLEHVLALMRLRGPESDFPRYRGSAESRATARVGCCERGPPGA